MSRDRARARVREALLAGGPVGSSDPQLVPALRARITEAASDDRQAPVTITARAMLAHLDVELGEVEHAPGPFVADRSSVRGWLLRRAVRDDLEQRHAGAGPPRPPPPSSVVARAWQQEASREPGDPASISAWLNRCAREDAQPLCAEISELVAEARELWPLDPGDPVVVSVGRPLDVRLGRLRLVARPDVVVAAQAEPSRTLALDLVSGRPRARRDRLRLRWLALVVALDRGRAPVRWASWHLTDGRFEVEALDPAVLTATAERVLAVADAAVSHVRGKLRP